MRVLQVCKKFPYPVKDGEGVAVRALALGLAEAGATVDLLSFNTSKHRVINLDEVDLPHYNYIDSCDLDNEVKPIDAAVSLLRSDSYHVTRFRSDGFQRSLRHLLTARDYDAVVLETSILAMYIPTIRACSEAVIALRTHNIEHEIWARIARKSPWYTRPFYAAFARRLRRFERKWINSPDVLLPITQRDSERLVHDLGAAIPRHVVPVGYQSVDTNTQAHKPLHALPAAISFIGSLDWAPNLEGLDYFLYDVWPLLRREFPELEFHIAGRKTPRRLISLDVPGVIVHGEVDDSAAFLQRYPLTVAPILSGSGTRVKILDAMVCGRVVLTTPMGLEGIAALDRKEVLICRTPTAFIDQVRYVLDNPSELERIGNNARALIREQFDFARIGFGLAACIRDARSDLTTARS